MPGYVIYWHRYTPELPDFKLQENKYNRIKDFGIVPLVYVDGLPSNVHYDVVERVKKVLASQGLPASEIKSFVIYKNPMETYLTTHIPWHALAPNLCEHKIPLEVLDKRLNKLKVDKYRIVFLENSTKGKQLLAHLAEEDIDAIDVLRYVLERIHQKTDLQLPLKSYEPLYDYVYDCHEYYAWYGVRKGIDNIHRLIEQIYRDYIERVMYKVLGLHWFETYPNLEDKVLKAIQEYE